MDHKIFNFIIIGLGIAIFLKFLLLLMPQPVWWDSAIYIGMGKYIFSGGALGLWEDLRPPLLPFFFGLVWKAGLLQFLPFIYLILFIMILFLEYSIVSRFFGRLTAALTTLFLAVTPVFFSYSTIPLSEAPSTLLALASLHFFLKNTRKRFFIAGFLAGLAFLARFPQGVIIACLVLGLFLRASKQRIRECILDGLSLLAGFSLVTVPYFVFNIFHYGHPLKPMLLADIVIKDYSWLYNLGAFYHFKQLFFQSWLFVFAFPGIIAFYNHFRKNRILAALVLPGIMILGYFTILAHKEARYMYIGIPYLAILVSLGLVSVLKAIRNKAVLRVMALAVILQLILMMSASFLLGIGHISPAIEKFYNYPRGAGIKGTILATSPVFMAYSDNRLFALVSWQLAPELYSLRKPQSAAIAVNTCEYSCAPADVICPSKRESFLSLLASENKLVFNESEGTCSYLIFRPR